MSKRLAVLSGLLFFSRCCFSQYLELEDDEAVYNPHIVGGSNTDIQSHPYAVGLYYGNGLFCGGNIISESIVLTAAHCFHRRAYLPLTVRAGSTYMSEKLEVRNVNEILVHPLNEEESFDYDVSLLFLEKPFTFTKSLAPIALSKLEPPVGTEVSVLGWGLTSENGVRSNQLQVATLLILEGEECRTVYQNLFTPRMICAGLTAGSADACNSDSGGPMVYENQLLGIISFGLGCARSGIPGAYASIPVLRNWIIEAARNHGIKLE